MGAGGLYRPETERDNCGVGFVADIKGKPTRATVERSLAVLKGLTHRGAVGSDPLTGDGCGILAQLPDAFFRCRAKLGFTLPPAGQYGVGQIFLPTTQGSRRELEGHIEATLRDQGLVALGWREVPIDIAQCGPVARENMPYIAQVFVGVSTTRPDPVRFDQTLFRARKEMEKRAKDAGELMYVCSLSSRTIVYKGLLLPDRLDRFYPDLADPTFTSALALVHQRFSTNTFPSWERAHPYRLIAHNGEINTLHGNINWMRAREPSFASSFDTQASDSATFDHALELLSHAGRSLPHALMMMVPEAWESNPDMTPELRAFYEFHASLMEPWDGPALIAFSDGRLIGGCLDRNGLRPARYLITTDGTVVMSSEAGVIDIPPGQVEKQERLRPGHMLLVDTGEGRIISDEALKSALASRRPYNDWLDSRLLRTSQLPEASSDGVAQPQGDALSQAQRTHGYTREDLRLVLTPMAETGQEPLGAMGDDSALAVLSERPQLLFNYFKQLFAQVTNPPIDPIRESLVMSLRTLLGGRQSLFAETPEHCRQLELLSPILSDERLQQIRELDAEGLSVATLSALFPVRAGGLGDALRDLRRAALNATRSGATILVLSDRGHDERYAPIPSLLALAAVHHHLIRHGVRQRCSLIVESGEPREVMHFCLLIGFGAHAVNPYLAYASLDQLGRDELIPNADPKALLGGYTQSIEKGLLKVLSKMGISTLQSYQGAQIFEAIGLGPDLIEEFFPGTVSRLGGIELDIVEQEYLMRHEEAYGPGTSHSGLDWGGRYKWRRDGERHQFTPNVVGLLQHGVRSANYKIFKKYSKHVNEHTTRDCDLRGLLELEPGESIPIEQVEPATHIVKRFRTGAMSFGSLSKEAHETLAVAMNRIGGRSNSGEGGEDPARYATEPNGDSKSSAIKQVASGRFGVTPQYLLNAEELQIKMAQGAKPGEGGQLPGHKVDHAIAEVRHSTPGVGLISPPPHHDIYSIEDLAQLIYDLKNANPRANVSVKLVSEVGVGTVAAGVAKARADHIVISGHSGGTGASPLSSIKHAGLPWELGLAEAQQVLIGNDLRGRVTLEVDGQLKTGRDVVIAALLGAENFAFGTAALVASGCILMRVCHLNTCPVGVATQDPALRKQFAGLPDHVINFMMFVAEEVRELMATLGFRRMDEMIGRVDHMRARCDLEHHWKAKHLDLGPLLHTPNAPSSSARRQRDAQDHGLDDVLDRKLIAKCEPALVNRQPIRLAETIGNGDRTACTMLSSEVIRRHGARGLPPGTIELQFTGAAGQSFGAFLAPGIEVALEGIANDSVAKGMSGGRIALRPHRSESFRAEANVLVGNVALYGATGGELFVRGAAGERFAVRNSGATAVVEALGDHGCEYMTGGTVVVLGRTGRNFAAGMSGGVAYVLDVDGDFSSRCNLDMVTLESLTEEDMSLVHTLVAQHRSCTESRLAWRILSAWTSCRTQFVKVMPQEYKRALMEQNDIGQHPRAAAG